MRDTTSMLCGRLSFSICCMQTAGAKGVLCLAGNGVLGIVTGRRVVYELIKIDTLWENIKLYMKILKILIKRK